MNKVSKKYALNNSYFKNRLPTAPANPFEVLEYFEKYAELPFAFEGTDWVYECFIEYQKRRSVENSQFFTPLNTANRMAELLKQYATSHDDTVIDACCGFGMLSKAVKEVGFDVVGFDVDARFESLYAYYVGSKKFRHSDHTEYHDGTFSMVISNPPYEVSECTSFFVSLSQIMESKGVAVLLLPKGFVDKSNPRKTHEAVSKFSVKHREVMSESFAHTKVTAEIVVLVKN